MGAHDEGRRLRQSRLPGTQTQGPTGAGSGSVREPGRGPAPAPALTLHTLCWHTVVTGRNTSSWQQMHWNVSSTLLRNFCNGNGRRVRPAAPRSRQGPGQDGRRRSRADRPGRPWLREARAGSHRGRGGGRQPEDSGSLACSDPSVSHPLRAGRSETRPGLAVPQSRTQNDHVTQLPVPNLPRFHLKFFNFTMVYKQFKFSRTHTSGF